jgi:adenine-specific DNA-methyltransferase
MRGFVSTPHAIVDIMVEKLFAGKPPTRNSTLIDPGCGPGAFIAGVLRWCARHKNAVPKIVGYENEPSRYMEATARFRDVPTVTVLRQDFLTAREGAFDYVIGNPPYVPITELSKSEKARFRRRFSAARGRFDLDDWSLSLQRSSCMSRLLNLCDVSLQRITSGRSSLSTKKRSANL